MCVKRGSVVDDVLPVQRSLCELVKKGKARSNRKLSFRCFSEENVYRNTQHVQSYKLLGAIDHILPDWTTTLTGFSEGGIMDSKSPRQGCQTEQRPTDDGPLLSYIRIDAHQPPRLLWCHLRTGHVSRGKRGGGASSWNGATIVIRFTTTQCRQNCERDEERCLPRM